MRAYQVLSKVHGEEGYKQHVGKISSLMHKDIHPSSGQNIRPYSKQRGCSEPQMESQQAQLARGSGIAVRQGKIYKEMGDTHPHAGNGVQGAGDKARSGCGRSGCRAIRAHLR